MPANNLLSRVLRIEPGISLGQWMYDRIIGNWDRLVAIFVGAGGMSYLASVTEWLRLWGPVGIGGIGLLSGLGVWIGLAWAQALRARAEEQRARVRAIEKWKKEVDVVNPLDEEFTRKRIRVNDIVNPFTKKIEDKSFIDCELHGPATIVAMGS